MARLTPRFSAERTVREYTEQHYLPAAAAFRARAADQGAPARALLDELATLTARWRGVRFGALMVASDGNEHRLSVEVFLNGIAPADVRVELFADGLLGAEVTRVPMSADGACYRAAVPATRPAWDYTPRVTAASVRFAVPIEAPFILWQK
jgi:starch phosphorylase